MLLCSSYVCVCVSTGVHLNKTDKMIPHCHCNFLNHFIIEVHPFNLLLLKQAICRCEQLQRMPYSNSFVGAVTAAINGFSRTLWDLKNTQQDSSACNIIKKLIPVQNGLSSL